MKKALTIIICILFIGIACVAVVKNYNDNKTADYSDNNSTIETTKPEYYNTDKIEIIDDNTAIVPDSNIKSMHEIVKYSDSCNYELTVNEVYYDNKIKDIIKEKTINYESHLSSLCSDKKKSPYKEYIDENGNLDGVNYTYMYVEITIKNMGESNNTITPLSHGIAAIENNKIILYNKSGINAAFVTEIDDKGYLNYMVVVQMDKGEEIRCIAVYPIEVSRVDNMVLFKSTGNGRAVFSNNIEYIRLKED